MRIFGLEITRWSKEKETTRDKVTIRSISPSKTPISKIPLVKPQVMSYAQANAGGRGRFIAPEYDLAEIGIVEDVDGFVRQAFKKKIALMFKEGWGYSGKNKDTIQYIKTRMAQIARASSIPTNSLLKKIGTSLIRVSNAFVIKVRDPKASGGAIRRDANGKKLKPIAGYFPAAPETMYIDLNQDTGEVNKYRQELPNGYYREFAPENVIHFTIEKREGFIYGIPSLIPVIDDVRALRQIEENVEILLYQHLFPLFQYVVGTETHPAGLDENGNKEIDLVKDQIQLMPLEGGIVTPERHEIRAIGAEGRAIRAEGYLEHFKKRVIAGLGISQIDLGDGQTANRGTARSMSRGLVDTVKDIQDELECQWNQYVISELLLESTFGDDVLEEENFVFLKFVEIDIENKMEQEKHAIELFKANGLTFDEFRAELSQEPIPVPEDPQDQDLSKYPEWALTYWKLFEEPLNIIRSIDEPWTIAAQAASQMRSLGVTQQQQRIAGQETEKAEKRAAEEDRKTKIAVTKARPKPIRKKDHYLATSFKELEEDTVERVKKDLNLRKVIDYDYILSYARTWAAEASKKMISLAMVQLIKGFNDETGMQSRKAEELIIRGRGEVEERIERLITKLALYTINQIRRRVDSNTQDVTIAGDIHRISIAETHVAFDVSKYRADFIYDVEIRKAYNFGRLLGLRFMDVIVKIDPSPDCCDRCRVYAARIENASFLDISEVVPIHPNCKCSLKVVQRKEDSEPLSDGTKLERCVLKVKAQLKEKHSDWDEDKIKSSAFAICSSKIKE